MKGILKSAVRDSQMVLERQKIREAKDFIKADELRAELSALGIQVSDTPQGSFWEVQK